MDSEINSFIKVWLSSTASICYCYFIVRHIPRGIPRLLSLLPIFYLFIILPLQLHCLHLLGPTVFYLVWLANFKLILFSFNHGPLSSQSSSHSLLCFISTALLPIKPKQDPTQNPPPKSRPDQNPPPKSHPGQNPPPRSFQNHGISPNQSQKDHVDSGLNWGKLAVWSVKALILTLIIRAYDYRQHFHPYFILVLYCCHVYLAVELVLAITSFLVPPILGQEIEPQFNEPYLATSLQDFWGRRWNLMVTSILRPTVYEPVRNLLTGLLGRRSAQAMAMVATFLVSGIMHEIIYFYLTRVGPTWEVTWFFVIHGFCTAAEVAVKKAVAGRWTLHRAVSVPMTLGFVAATGEWLFFPQIFRNGVDLKAIGEYSMAMDYVSHYLIWW